MIVKWENPKKSQCQGDPRVIQAAPELGFSVPHAHGGVRTSQTPPEKCAQWDGFWALSPTGHTGLSPGTPLCGGDTLKLPCSRPGVLCRGEHGAQALSHPPDLCGLCHFCPRLHLHHHRLPLLQVGWADLGHSTLQAGIPQVDVEACLILKCGCS